ncbi:hypothetical protein LguiB_033908 [Lonicera macranthoides]
MIGNTVFEPDENSAGSAKFVPLNANWGTSSTGDFWGRNRTINDYTATNVSVLRVNDSELYTTARLSPLSLTYYGRCLANGNYTVTLHFAEIILRDNRSFQSLGRRIFDVYIQGERKLKDFDIEHKAEGVDRVVRIQFKVIVKDKSLEIRFHYAGKGTTAVPMRGTYGPLISAISVKSDGTIIAVKQLSSKSRQGNREFVNEIGMISGLQHENLVKLYGCCVEGKQLLLVYEYMENNSLATALFGKLMFYFIILSLSLYIYIYIYLSTTFLLIVFVNINYRSRGK